MAFTARFSGHCTAGGDHIEPGEQIEEDEHGGWSHEVCADWRDQHPPRKPAAVCPECWLEQPCPCGD